MNTDGTRDVSIAQAFTQIKEWLDKNFPALASDLNSAASIDDINLLGKHIGHELPDDFYEVYKLHNGQNGRASSLFCGWSFLRLDQINREWQINQELFEDKTLKHEVSSVEPQTIQEFYAHPSRIPFASDGGGNYLGIDLAPGAKGSIGQVINFGRDEKQMYVISLSLRDFLMWFAQSMRNDVFKVTDDPDLGEFLDTADETDNFISLALKGRKSKN